MIYAHISGHEVLGDEQAFRSNLLYVPMNAQTKAEYSHYDLD